MQHSRWIQATAVAIAAFVSVSDACVQPPPVTSPGVCLDKGSLEITDDMYTVDIYVKGYTLFGGSPGQFCSCAFNLPTGTKLCEIISARVTFPGTDIPVPGFGSFDNTAAGDQAWDVTLSGNWYSFVAPVEVPLGVGNEVDLCFKLQGKLPEPPPGGGTIPGPVRIRGFNSTTMFADDVFDQIILDVEQALVGASIGTDEAAPNGVPLDAHQSITGLGRVMVETLAFESLGGGVAGTAGDLLLVGSGTPSASSGGGELALLGALPSESALLFLGLENVSLPYFGGTFVPSVDAVVSLQTDTLGEASTTIPALPAALSGFDLFTQVWMNDAGAEQGLAGSNALRTLLE